MMNRQEKGKLGERIAEEYLMKNNIRIISRNFRSAHGEIDLVGGDEKRIIFFEVKYRENDSFGPVEYAIDMKKAQKILFTSRYFLLKNPAYAQSDLEYRGILITKKNGRHQIKVIKNLLPPDNIINGFI